MKIKRPAVLLLVCATIAIVTRPASAEDPLKIGIVTSLSGHGAVTGAMIRDGFALGLKQLGGKLGGRETQIVVEDDETKPEVAIGKAKALVERDKADFVVGTVFSNILMAIVKPVTDAGAFLITPNAGPSTLAGKACNPNFFSTSYQNDQVHEVVGKYAQDSGVKTALLLAPNYQAGKDALAGFKRYFKGEVLDEVYVPLGTLDFAAELARIAVAKPEAIYVFLPGGMGVNFVKQFHQAGLADKVKFLSAFTVDEATLPAQQDAAVGLYGGSNWAPNLDTPQNKSFVAAYEKAYGIIPASYAFEAYDAALLIDSALRQTHGSTADKDALRAALKNGRLQIAARQFQVQQQSFPDPGLLSGPGRQAPRRQIRDRRKGGIAKKVFSDFGDSYAADCAMK